jgi:hypothetical protein
LEIKHNNILIPKFLIIYYLLIKLVIGSVILI